MRCACASSSHARDYWPLAGVQLAAHGGMLFNGDRRDALASWRVAEKKHSSVTRSFERKGWRPLDGPIHVRRFRSSDASVREGGLPDFSPERVLAWSPSRPGLNAYQAWARRSLVSVAVEEADCPIGYARYAIGQIH